jgi:hypothetical protein
VEGWTAGWLWDNEVKFQILINRYDMIYDTIHDSSVGNVNV